MQWQQGRSDFWYYNFIVKIICTKYLVTKNTILRGFKVSLSIWLKCIYRVKFKKKKRNFETPHCYVAVIIVQFLVLITIINRWFNINYLFNKTNLEEHEQTHTINILNRIINQSITQSVWMNDIKKSGYKIPNLVITLEPVLRIMTNKIFIKGEQKTINTINTIWTIIDYYDGLTIVKAIVCWLVSR